MKILESPFVKDMVEMTTNMYRLGWDERNGGNVSYLLDDFDLNEYDEIGGVIRTIPLGFDASFLSGHSFIVTGTGKYFKNVQKDPENNLGVVRISEDGHNAELLWGFSDGGRFTSEFPAHIMSHIERLRVCPENRIILHTHPTNLTAMTMVHKLEDRAFTYTLWQMCTECIVVFPDGVGVLPWMVCGNTEIGVATANKMKDYRVVIWSIHGIYGAGRTPDEAFGLVETVEKAAQLYMLQAHLPHRNTISDQGMKALAKAFGFTYRTDFLGKEPVWIWSEDEGNDTYREFFKTFEVEDPSADCVLRLSADGAFAVHLNGTFVPASQYPDYPFYKSVETVDLKPFLRKGLNQLSIVVWHIGLTTTSVYYPAKPGLWYELKENGETIAVSDTDTLVRSAPGYRQGICKQMNSQYGVSFAYDGSKEAKDFVKAVEVDKKCTFVERPVKPLTVGKPVKAVSVTKVDEDVWQYDFGKETVGYPGIRGQFAESREMTVTWGETIMNGRVRRFIGSRDYSFLFTPKNGNNDFFNPFTRIACRYVEVKAPGCEHAPEFVLRPVDYPVNVLPFDCKDERRQMIYDTCVHTLRCCMHDHYEDGPHREQALYVLDSRNQMLSGYFAFGEYDYPEKNLLLFAKGQRTDGLMPLCAPSGSDWPIPMFSLAYLLAVDEFEKNANRLACDEIFDACEKIMKVFDAKRSEKFGGLIPEFEAPCWNFYEWSQNCDDNDFWSKKGVGRPERASLILNAIYLLAKKAEENILTRRGVAFEKFDYEPMQNAIRARFRRADGRFSLFETLPETNSLLANSLALLSGAVPDGEKKDFSKVLTDKNLTVPTLSMKGFWYEALLESDPENKDVILNDIDEVYGYMLDAGATTFWETIKGATEFGSAGSLCHGWSALPIYYYHKLLG